MRIGAYIKVKRLINWFLYLSNLQRVTQFMHKT